MLRVRTQFDGPIGAPWLSTMYFVGDDTSSGATAAVGKVGDFWAACDDSMTNQLTWATLGTVELLSPAGVLLGSFSAAVRSGAGIQSVQVAPRSSQMEIRWETGVFRAGRRIFGKTYLPGNVTGNLSASGDWNTAFVTATQGRANALRLGPVPQLAVWSKKNSTVDVVTGGVALPRVAVLRSRRD